jgi:hypothetical protein
MMMKAILKGDADQVQSVLADAITHALSAQLDEGGTRLLLHVQDDYDNRLKSEVALYNIELIEIPEDDTMDEVAAAGTLRPEHYRAAIDAQTACNLGAIVRKFNRVMLSIQHDARRFNHGTDWIRNHPICRLFAQQIAYLSQSEFDSAYRACEAGAKGEDPGV